MPLVERKTIEKDTDLAEELYGTIILNGENWRLHDNGMQTMLWINQPGLTYKQSFMVECPEDVEVILRKGLKLETLEEFLGTNNK